MAYEVEQKTNVPIGQRIAQGISGAVKTFGDLQSIQTNYQQAKENSALAAAHLKELDDKHNEIIQNQSLTGTALIGQHQTKSVQLDDSGLYYDNAVADITQAFKLQGKVAPSREQWVAQNDLLKKLAGPNSFKDRQDGVTEMGMVAVSDNNYDKKVGEAYAKAKKANDKISAAVPTSGQAQIKEYSSYLDKSFEDAQKRRLTYLDSKNKWEGENNRATTASNDKVEAAAVKAVDEGISYANGSKGGQSNVGRNQVKLGTADDLQSNLSLVKSGKLAFNDTIEAQVATQIAALEQGGQRPPAYELVKHFMSNTGQKTVAGVLQYFTAHPKEAVSSGFVDQYIQIADRQQKFYQEATTKSIRSIYKKNEAIFSNPKYGDREKGRFIDSVKEAHPWFDASKLDGSQTYANTTNEKLAEGESIKYDPSGKAVVVKDGKPVRWAK